MKNTIVEYEREKDEKRKRGLKYAKQKCKDRKLRYMKEE